MNDRYVHGYDAREGARLQDQAATLAELLHGDTRYPAGHRVLEAGCGVGAQTRARVAAAGLIDAAAMDRGIRDLYRAAEPDGVFCYTFFKAVGRVG
jgi:cyclopropane fatty-acyl-phospholipid synthase-like methyltransferase